MTKIEWTEATWNPTTGCDRVSPGCDNCYALTMAKRLKGMGSAKYQNDGDPRTSGPGFGVTTHADVVAEPMSWRKPRRVFVNSMSDLFHDNVPDAFIARVFGAMALTPQHTYQVLTKRHARMRSLLNHEAFQLKVLAETARQQDENHPMPAWNPGARRLQAWPPSNVWLGVSVENQKWADIRIPALLDTPAAVRFLSCEPLLGPVDLWGPLKGGHRPTLTYWLDGRPQLDEGRTTRTGLTMHGFTSGPRLDWVIVGGESGHGARPLDPAWTQTVVDQCRESGVAAFVKQLGSVWARENGADRKGGDPQYWPAGLRVRKYPQAGTDA